MVLSYNELAAEIAGHYAEKGEKVLLMDLDPEITEFFREKGFEYCPTLCRHGRSRCLEAVCF